jgi:hypothetical protein
VTPELQVLLEREMRHHAQHGPEEATANDFLDRVKQLYGLTSDYSLAKLSGLRTASISLYRNARVRAGGFNDDSSLKIAALLRAKGDNAQDGYVLACMSRQRARSVSARAAWRDLAKTLYDAGRPLP